MATADSNVIPDAQTTWANAGLSLRAGSVGPYSGVKKVAPGGVDLDVLMCVSTWEHTWLRDWGVAGKREFLEAWWECIDWGVVEANAGGARSKQAKPTQGAPRTQDY